MSGVDDGGHPVTRAIRDRVDAHEPYLHGTQWYVAECCIDCDAGEFWRVVDEAVRAALGEAAGG
jgi:hypothetical protein